MVGLRAPLRCWWSSPGIKWCESPLGFCYYGQSPLRVGFNEATNQHSALALKSF